jgi:hypothetical protein
VAIPLLEYSPSTQNQRVAGYVVPGDDQPRIFSTDNILSYGDMTDLIEAAYRQIFFHAFAADREPFLESQLRNGQITVRDFVRGLVLSDTYRRSFYDLNSNYRFVEQTVQRVLGRDVYGKQEKIAWSIVVATKGIVGFIDELLSSQEYIDAFGYNVLPYVVAFCRASLRAKLRSISSLRATTSTLAASWASPKPFGSLRFAATSRKSRSPKRAALPTSWIWRAASALVVARLPTLPCRTLISLPRCLVAKA